MDNIDDRWWELVWWYNDKNNNNINVNVNRNDDSNNNGNIIKVLKMIMTIFEE